MARRTQESIKKKRVTHIVEHGDRAYGHRQRQEYTAGAGVGMGQANQLS